MNSSTAPKSAKAGVKAETLKAEAIKDAHLLYYGPALERELERIEREFEE